MDRKKFEEWIRKFARRLDPAHRRRIHSAGRTAWRAIAIFTVLSGVISFAVNGTELFTKKIPSATAAIGKYVLLAKTGRPFLLRRLIEKDLALANACPGKVLVVDFDGDGQATDLVIELLTRNEQGQCTQDSPDTTAYALMKDSPTSGLWPRYTLLRLIARDDIGNFHQGTMYQLSFEQRGKFLVGKVFGTDFPGWIVYGYSNGQMYDFGRFRPSGSLSEIEGSEPISQIGDKLFLPTEAGIVSLEINPDSQFSKTLLTSKDIVQRNNTALVLEVYSSKPDDDALKDVRADGSSDLKAVANAAFDACGRWAIANGQAVSLKPASPQSAKCLGELHVHPITTILPMVACDFSGFVQTEQFPWGRVLDPNAKNPSITCPVDGESNASDTFSLKVVVD